LWSDERKNVNTLGIPGGEECEGKNVRKCEDTSERTCTTDVVVDDNLVLAIAERERTKGDKEYSALSICSTPHNRR